jgi:hypothetical protein
MREYTAADHYNLPGYYRTVNKELRRAFVSNALTVGMPAPDFRLPTVDGGIADLGELRQQGNVVVVFGCHSAPPCFHELPRLDEAAQTFAGAVTLLVYTREIHPNEALPYGTFAHHRTAADKMTAARRLRDDLGLRIEVAVDDLDGHTHLAYGALPFTAVVIRRDGVLAHRTEWASATQLAPVVANLDHADRRRAAGATPRVSYAETLWLMEHLDKKP